MKYTIDNAIKEVKTNSKEKFDATVEIHINLDLEKGQSVRFITTLPHGTGKTKKIAVFASEKVEGADIELTESDIDKIAKGKIVVGKDFDVLVTEPRFMSKIAKVASILGPAGAMPNPKSGTVTENVAEAVKNLKLGQIEVRTEANAPLIHSIAGKVSWEKAKLSENIETFMKSLRQNKPAKTFPKWIKSAFIKSSMGKAYEINLE